MFLRWGGRESWRWHWHVTPLADALISSSSGKTVARYPSIWPSAGIHARNEELEGSETASYVTVDPYLQRPVKVIIIHQLVCITHKDMCSLREIVICFLKLFILNVVDGKESSSFECQNSFKELV